MLKFLAKAVLTAVVAAGLFGGVARADSFISPEPTYKKPITPTQYEPKKPVQYTVTTQWDSKKPTQYTPPTQYEPKKPTQVTPTLQGNKTQQQYVKPVPPPAPKKQY